MNKTFPAIPVNSWPRKFPSDWPSPIEMAYNGCAMDPAKEYDLIGFERHEGPLWERFPEEGRRARLTSWIAHRHDRRRWPPGFTGFNQR